MLKDAGAKEVHLRISSPPFLWPCYYGTDIPSKDELIACKHTVEEIGKMSLCGFDRVPLRWKISRRC